MRCGECGSDKETWRGEERRGEAWKSVSVHREGKLKVRKDGGKR